MESNIKVHSPQLIETTPAFGCGENRWWGACLHCGHVEELSVKAAQDWQRTGTCEYCTEELAQEDREARWYRGGPF